MLQLYYSSATYSSSFKNILTNIVGKPFSLLIAILLSFISLSLNNILSNSSLRDVSICKSFMILSKSSFITLPASISISFPLQYTNIL